MEGEEGRAPSSPKGQPAPVFQAGDLLPEVTSSGANVKEEITITQEKEDSINLLFKTGF